MKLREGRVMQGLGVVKQVDRCNTMHPSLQKAGTVKLGDKERFDQEQIGVREPFPVTNGQFTS